MCGIAGILTLRQLQPAEFLPSRFDPVEPASAEQQLDEQMDAMLALLQHRGPDNTGRILRAGVALGHTRLSIIDVDQAADQPMISPDGRYAIVYNGEIYNFPLLREELQTAGVKFHTHGDTEVLLQAHLHWGWDALHRLNGMFAFAIYDFERHSLFAARDRFGIKPFHYVLTDRHFLFASEIKSLIAALPHRPRFNACKLAELLLYREAIEQDLLTGIHCLEPGHAIELHRQDASGLHIRRWFHVSELPEREHGGWLRKQKRAERLNALDRLLNQAVERHLISDVPVGSLCSGGVDSSLITAMACRLRPDVTVFHVDVKDCSEARWAELVARHLDIDIQYSPLDRDNYLANYIECIWYNDAPLTHPQNVPIYHVSELARRNGCKVLITGEGADEGFGGYDWRYRMRWNWLRLERMTGLLRRLYRKFVFSTTGLWLQRPRHDFVFRAWSNPTDVLDVVADRGFRSRLEQDCRAAYAHLEDSSEREVAAAMTADLRDYIGAILHQQDRASMQAGIESRVPFLDYEVARFAANLPLSDKIDRRHSKLLIKDLALRYLPKDIVNRTKIGFASPASEYVLSLGARCFHNGFLAREGGLSPAQTAALLDKDAANFTHVLYGLEFWGRMFIYGESAKELTERYLA